mmetsp:Transcript_142747/g.455702  ORF Transcript_142747/g.455702 Transcript_142747/m.455702 type:complete len:262 (-) Transcript_142747:771-1556(-)
MGGRDAASTHCKWPGTPKSAAVPLPLQSFHSRQVLLWCRLPCPERCSCPRSYRLGTGITFAGCVYEHSVRSDLRLAGQVMALAHRLCQHLGPHHVSHAHRDTHGCGTNGGHRAGGKGKGAWRLDVLDVAGVGYHSTCRTHYCKLPPPLSWDHVRRLLVPPQGHCGSARPLLQDSPRQGKCRQNILGLRPARGPGADLRDRPQLNTKFGRPPHPGGLIKDVVRRGDRHCTALQHPHGAGALRRLLAPRRSGDSGLVRLMDRG